jgi:hypothetical protein
LAYVPGQHFTGDRIPANALLEILFISEACPLRIAHPEMMLLAWKGIPGNQVGCWHLTLEGNYVFVEQQLWTVMHASNVQWRRLPRGLLHTDGSVTITEPSYNGDDGLVHFGGRDRSPKSSDNAAGVRESGREVLR